MNILQYDARGELLAKRSPDADANEFPTQLRALMYVTSLTSEIMDAMVAMENAVEGALERQTTFHPVKFYLRKKSAAYTKCAQVKQTHRACP